MKLPASSSQSLVGGWAVGMDGVGGVGGAEKRSGRIVEAVGSEIGNQEAY